MKQWLVRAATAAVQKGAHSLAKGDLESQAVCMAQCEQLYREIADGELKLEERRDVVIRYRSKLGLTDHASVKATPPAASRFRFRRPGQRLPVRDTGFGSIDRAAWRDDAILRAVAGGSDEDPTHGPD